MKMLSIEQELRVTLIQEEELLLVKARMERRLSLPILLWDAVRTVETVCL